MISQNERDKETVNFSFLIKMFKVMMYHRFINIPRQK